MAERTAQPSDLVISTALPYNGPKLFVKPTPKNNHFSIQNAISKALEGAANAKALNKIQETISANSKTCSHFLILFRDRYQFRGLYEYNSKTDSITKLEGIGPKSIKSSDIKKYYKYETPKRQFTEVQTNHMSLNIIAFTLQEHIWTKPRPRLTGESNTNSLPTPKDSAMDVQQN